MRRPPLSEIEEELHEATAKADRARRQIEEQALQEEQERENRLAAWDKAYLDSYDAEALQAQENEAWADFRRAIADSPWGKALAQAWAWRTIRQMRASHARSVAEQLGRPLPAEVQLRERSVMSAVQDAVQRGADEIARAAWDEVEQSRTE